jgi:predicted transcriptional regulator of viral defense system
MIETNSIYNSIKKGLEIFRQNNGQLRTRDALRLGIRLETLSALRDSGDLDQIGRGLYRLTDLPPLSNPDLVVVASKIPHAVICLISALAFHELTLQIPHVVDIAVEGHKERPILRQPPIRVFWYSGKLLTEGIEIHQIDGTPVRIYGPEKSLADVFKYRNKIGADVALEALKFYRQRHKFDAGKLLYYARICRVENVMRPYLETLI